MLSLFDCAKLVVSCKGGLVLPVLFTPTVQPPGHIKKVSRPLPVLSKIKIRAQRSITHYYVIKLDAARKYSKRHIP